MILAFALVSCVLVLWVIGRVVDNERASFALEVHGLRSEVDVLRREQEAFRRLVRRECASSVSVEQLWQQARKEARRDA